MPYLLDYEHGKTFTDLYREEMAAAVRTLDKARKLAFDKMDDSAAFEDIGPGNSPDEILTVAAAGKRTVSRFTDTFERRIVSNHIRPDFIHIRAL